MRHRLAVLTSHPIQYQAPLFRHLSRDGRVDLKVYFECPKEKGQVYFDREFGREIAWDIPLLEGYDHEFIGHCSWPWKRMRDFMPHALLVLGWSSFMTWKAVYGAAGSGVPVMMRSETPLSHEMRKSGIKQALKRSILRLFFRRVDAFLYIGRDNKDFYISCGVPERKLFFVPYAVENERFMKCDSLVRSGNRREEVRNALGAGGDDVVILFSGKLIPKKRPFDLLSAYEILRNEQGVRNIYLVFVGDGVLKRALERRVEEAGIPGVSFVGFRNQTEIPEYYAAADILVLPSGMGETWGLAVNEGMCSGLPVVVSDSVGCSTDLVEGKETGSIFPEGDVQALHRALEKFVRDPSLRDACGKNSRHLVKEYSFEKDVLGIISAMESIMNGR